MSLNSLIAYKNTLFNEKVEEALRPFYDPSRAISVEQRQYLEDLLQTILEDLEAHFEVFKVSIRDEPVNELLLTNISNIYQYVFLISKLIDDLFNEYQKVVSFENSKLNDLNKVANSIKQKLSSLNLFSGDVRFIFTESFSTNEFLVKKDNTLRASGGLLTLPVDSSTDISISHLSIGSKSIGALGSSDPDNPATSDLNDVIAGEALQWEELEDTSAILNLEIDFLVEETINQLKLKFASIESVSSAIVTSIRCYSKNKFIELLTENVEITPEDVSIPFYPVKTSKLFVTIQQTNSYSYSLSDNEVLFRKVIALSEIKPQLVKYVSVGAIESSRIPISGLPSASQVSIDLLPTNSNLYKIDFVYSIDNGQSWLKDDVIGASFNIESLYWKSLITRNDGAFTQNSSAHEAETEFEYTTQIEFVSGFKSPNSFVLNKKAISGDITIIQPKVFRVGGKKRELKIGEGTGSILRIKTPIDLYPLIAEDSTLRVNGKDWTYVNTLTGQAADAEVWSVDKDSYRWIIFGDDTEGRAPAATSIITFALELEDLLFKEVNEGYRTNFDYLFDPDKDNIVIYYVSESDAGGKQILQKGENFHKLLFSNIVEGSIVLTEKTSSGSAYTSPIAISEIDFNGGDFTLAVGEFTIDYQNGILYLYEDVPNDDVMTITFRYFPTRILDKNKFKVVIEDKVPTGVLVEREAFPAKTVIDEVGLILTELRLGGQLTLPGKLTASTGEHQFNFSRKHPIIGTVNAFDLFFNTTLVPAEEIEFIDGYTEFLGLIKVDSEKTSEFAGPGVVSFIVRGGANFYAPLGVSFDNLTIFAVEVTAPPASPGEWRVDIITGEVEVYVDGDGLPSGINYNYYYRDNSFDSTNKFSVDYKKGKLYSTTGFKSGGTVTYKTGNFYAAYDLALQVTDFTFDKNTSIVEVKTENNFDFSKLIKIIYPIKILDLTIEDLKDYYSPLIRNIIFRFN